MCDEPSVTGVVQVTTQRGGAWSERVWREEGAPKRVCDAIALNKTLKAGDGAVDLRHRREAKRQ